MPLNTVHNRAVTMKNSDKITTQFLPNKDIAIIASSCYVVTLLSNKDSFFDVCMCVAVATKPVFVVVNRLLWCLESLMVASSISMECMITGAAI